MRGRQEAIDARGAELIFIGNGSVAAARSFGRLHVPGSAVYTDPSLRSYRALGMRRSLAATVGPASVLAAARSTLRGHVQGATRGDALQQGGLFTVAPGGAILYAERNRSAGDRPDIEAALGAL